MIYTELTIKAMNLAYHAHHGQFDKGGVPYIFHPIHLAEEMEDEISTCVALLHDTVEDTAVTLEDLEKEFPAEVVNAVRLLTHGEDVDYFDYVRAIRQNPIAVKVKLADLRHNGDPKRICNQGNQERRRAKYAAARAILEVDA
ncbi:MAG: HD domain-containing protein [Oscillospiraceae bacterium]|nr:HD domain-containing protein [Oscillospiraceae bacterium]